ncbi:hypothetical protein FQA47_021121 [Oryzias melastigma]|uniref:Uncharacterized protein n=1 Tax=Oryzias melastigma TaxID=30732 RepID=A0A834CB16_ORYME|nr:hypothetical protein FQA47_023166 [Oryzias melastigma]KAF6728593.1 hypothetical protein FQA47_021121 [Oryzias melastigma]
MAAVELSPSPGFPPNVPGEPSAGDPGSLEFLQREAGELKSLRGVEELLERLKEESDALGEQVSASVCKQFGRGGQLSTWFRETSCLHPLSNSVLDDCQL